MDNIVYFGRTGTLIIVVSVLLTRTIELIGKIFDGRELTLSEGEQLTSAAVLIESHRSPR